jgi:hypothetical protein
MNTTSDAADTRPTTVAFVNCFDGRTFGRVVYLTPDEERQLRNVLAVLRDYCTIPAWHRNGSNWRSPRAC